MGAISVPARAAPRAIVFARPDELAAARMESLRECHLRNALRRLVCSPAWEDQLYPVVSRGKLRPRDDAASALWNNRLYPPGGYETLMRRCDCCHRFVPPQAVATAMLCPRCIDQWFLDEELGDGGHVPSCRRCAQPPGRWSKRFSANWRSRVERLPAHSSPNDPTSQLGRCTACRGRWPDADGELLPARDHVLMPVRICDECDANRMTPGQMARATSGHRFDRVVPTAELPAHFEGEGYRRSRRAYFKCDDGRTAGGWVDYSRFEDGEIRPWFGIADAMAEEGTEPAADDPVGGG
jgi:hypothetical protein